MVVSVTFLSFAVESCCDSLVAYDGDTVTSATLMSVTSSRSTWSFVSRGRSVLLRWRSDGSIEAAGFEAVWMSVEFGTPPERVPSASSGLSKSQKLGIGLGVSLGFVALLVVVIVVAIMCQRRRYLRRAAAIALHVGRGGAGGSAAPRSAHPGGGSGSHGATGSRGDTRSSRVHDGVVTGAGGYPDGVVTGPGGYPVATTSASQQQHAAPTAPSALGGANVAFAVPPPPTPLHSAFAPTGSDSAVGVAAAAPTTTTPTASHGVGVAMAVPPPPSPHGSVAVESVPTPEPSAAVTVPERVAAVERVSFDDGVAALRACDSEEAALVALQRLLELASTSPSA
jgi:hypothetical protein